ncbi:MAG: hypothetical protein WCJ35_18955 [Planctomycetota bacterium]
MGFAYQNVDGRQFHSIDEARAEEHRMKRVPLGDLLDRGFEFFDDHSFGLPGNGLQFNEEGLRAFCGQVGAPFSLANRMNRGHRGL